MITKSQPEKISRFLSFLLQNMGKDPMGDGLLENVNVTDFIIERMRNFQPITPVNLQIH